MAFGRIPRFSPSFSSTELAAAARRLVRPAPDEPAVREFEAAFAERVGARHAVMVPSARYGFWLLLRAWGVGEGDEVVIPALTYFAIPAMVVSAGARPVFADVGATTYTVDPEALDRAITPRTKAVVPTHLFGLPCDMDAVLEVARRRGVRVIEDCAQATGARYRGKPCGSLGDAAYYTFGLTKNITTLRGAMVSTDSDETAAALRSTMATLSPIRASILWKEALTGAAMAVASHPLVYPWTLHPAVRLGNALGKDPIHTRFMEAEAIDPDPASRYAHSAPRAAQAAVGQRQLERLEALNDARRRNGRYLDEHLAHVPGVDRPTWPDAADPMFMSYVVQHDRREELAKRLLARGVDTTIGYMTDASTNPLFAAFSADCPRATAATRRLLHLPVHPHLSEGDLAHIAESVRHVAWAMLS